MSGAGLRNWRGEIIQPAVGGEASRDVVASDGNGATTASPPQPTGTLHRLRRGDASAVDENQHADEKKVFLKDEFGRDVEVVSDDRKSKHHRKSKHRHRDKSKDKERKKKHKHEKKCSRSSRSESPPGRLTGTPPPPDPFRPQLDEMRHGRAPRRHDRQSRSANRERSHRHRGSPRRSSRSWSRSRSRSWSRSRSRSVRFDNPHSRSRRLHQRCSASRSRSRSPRRGRRRSRSRSTGTSRHGQRRSAADTTRKWTHDAFDERSPSPVRQTDPFYRPEPETWVSRAGGVYVPRN